MLTRLRTHHLPAPPPAGLCPAQHCAAASTGSEPWTTQETHCAHCVKPVAGAASAQRAPACRSWAHHTAGQWQEQPHCCPQPHLQRPLVAVLSDDPGLHLHQLDVAGLCTFRGRVLPRGWGRHPVQARMAVGAALQTGGTWCTATCVGASSCEVSPWHGAAPAGSTCVQAPKPLQSAAMSEGWCCPGGR